MPLSVALKRLSLFIVVKWETEKWSEKFLQWIFEKYLCQIKRFVIATNETRKNKWNKQGKVEKREQRKRNKNEFIFSCVCSRFSMSLGVEQAYLFPLSPFFYSHTFHLLLLLLLLLFLELSFFFCLDFYLINVCTSRKSFCLKWRFWK